MATYTTNLNLKKPAQSDKIRIADINNNMDDIDAAFGAVGNDSVATQIGNIQGALAIVAVGDSHAAVTAGQFVYVRSHETLDAGLYVASANIAENGALSLSNLTADSSGGLNALNSKITNIPNNVSSSYNSLIEPTNLTTTETVYNTYNNRKFSDYVVLFFTIIIADYIRESVIIPTHVLTGYSTTGTSLNYTTGGINVEIVIRYNTDTSVKMKYNASSSKSVTVRIDALALENK